MFWFYTEYKKCIINSKEFISCKCCSQKATAIAVKWPNVLGIDVAVPLMKYNTA